MNKVKSIVIAVSILLVGVLLNNVLSNQKQPIAKKQVAQEIRELNTITVKNETINLSFEMSGTVSSRDKIDLYAEVSGVLEEGNKPFKEGIAFKKGETVFHINDDVYRNTVLAQKSSFLNQLMILLPDIEIDFPESVGKWNAYLESFDLNEPLKPIPDAANTRERNYLAGQNLYTAYYTVKGMEATLAKYSIVAPYDGIVTESNLNPGMLVMNGQRLGEFTGSRMYELESSVGLLEAKGLKPGMKVTMTSDDAPGTFDGEVERINKKIDRTSQTVMAYVISTDKRLKDGMYLTAYVNSASFNNVMKIPHRLLDDHNVYSLNDSTVYSHMVEIVGADNGNVIVRGLSDGLVLLDEGIKGIASGTNLKDVAME